MSSPAKKRKTNSYKPSSQPVRSLDYFFAKQKDAAKPNPLAERVKTEGEDASSGDAHASRIGKSHEKEDDLHLEGTSANVLSDEELARRLQEEWDKEDEAVIAQTNGGGVQGRERVEDINKEERGGKAEEIAAKEEGRPPDKVASSSFFAKPQGNSDKNKGTLSLQSTAADEDTVTANIPFDEIPLTFDPAKYIPDLQKHWVTEGGNASYALLTRCFILINGTTSRIKIVDTLVNLIRCIIEGDPESLLPAVWLATNSISPPYIDLELGLGGSAISKALKKVCGLNNAGLKALNDKHGDAGDVAFEAKKKQSFTLRKPKPLTIKSVFESLVKIANSKGKGSQEVKQRIVDRLIQDSRGAEESRYIVRTLVQHLRIGAVKTTMLIALGRAFLLSRPPGATFSTKPKSELALLKKEELAEVYHKAEEIVKACFARRPNYNDLVPTLLEIGVCEELLLRCGLALHIPLRPMLGSITRDLGEMLTKLQGRDFSCEYKYDGQRAQVHCDEDGKVTIFSRHLELMTDKYPDLVALVPKIRGEGVSSFIMEGEVVAIDKENGDLKTFQTLSNRARKDVVVHSVKIDVCLFAFDLMYLNGEELLNRPFRERRNLLRSLFIEIPHHFTWVKNLDATSADSEAVLEFFKSATDIKCEGIMVKILDNQQPDTIEPQDGTSPPALQPPPTPRKPKKNSKTKTTKPTTDPTTGRRKPLLSTYEPDKRLDSWLKVKKDYNASAETLDLIPIAAWHGSGRKSKWWSPILLALRNPQTGSLVAVTKCMSGFTDSFYIANREKYDPDSMKNVISRPAYVEYHAGIEPDVWFEPQEVWEVAFADVTLSPTYTAAIGLVSEERGLSMRFPRFLKVREDKGIEEASSDEFLADLWWKQEARAPAAAAATTTTTGGMIVDDGEGEGI
ncbi:ATP-dependent DNA ligase [Venturia nashicola]|nr:ATP-dependent DNA ligase [Venturia nashicola]